MKLVSFTVENFRSITQAHNLRLEQSTVLVGPNNEGKSNVLKALVVSMEVLTTGRFAVNKRSGQVREFFASPGSFDWKNDFPIQLQQKKPNGESIFELEFLLDSSEVEQFKSETGSSSNGVLPLKIALGQRSSAVTIKKKGPGGRAMSAKSARIAHFVSKRLEVRYIPAIRTANKAEEVVRAMVERELETIEDNPEYRRALELIEQAQRPILDQLSISVKAMLSSFLPAIKDVKFDIKNRRHALRQSTAMIVDDGTPTYLKYKGDGVKSLAALALMRHVSERGSSNKNLIIAVEEPESHLHPEAMHGLRKVLDDLSSNNQIVITTHSPVFVERHRVESNIIVLKRKARPARTLEEIRRILGVRAADNLKSADLVLVVEGEEDRTALRALLAHHSPHMKQALTSGSIAIDTLGGGSNLSYKLGELRNAVCKFHCFVDHDKCGRDAIEKAKDQGLISDAEHTFATCAGRPDSEIEDLLNVDLYETVIREKHNVSLDDPAFKGKKKWSDRMRDAFEHQGKSWTDKTERNVKQLVANEVHARPAAALNVHHRGPFDALVEVLLRRIGITSVPTSVTEVAVTAAEAVQPEPEHGLAVPAGT